MPRIAPLVKPLFKLSKTQVKRLLERSFSRKEIAKTVEGAHPQQLFNPEMMAKPTQPIGEGIMKFQPPSERTFGRLYNKNVPEGGLPKAQDYPYPEAYLRLMKDKGSSLKAAEESIPPTDALFKTRPGSPQELAGGFGYERRTFKGVGPSAERVGKALKPIEEAASETVPTNEVLQGGLLMDVMWKNLIRGKRTMAGRSWEELRQASNMRNKIPDAREYFIRCGLKYMEDPAKLAKYAPREARLIEHLLSEYKQAVKGR